MFSLQPLPIRVFKNIVKVNEKLRQESKRGFQEEGRERKEKREGGRKGKRREKEKGLRRKPFFTRSWEAWAVPHQ